MTSTTEIDLGIIAPATSPKSLSITGKFLEMFEEFEKKPL